MSLLLHGLILLLGPAQTGPHVDADKMKTRIFANEEGLYLAQVNVAWVIDHVHCPTTPIVRQRIKGHILRGITDDSGKMTTGKVTAEEIVKKATQRNKRASREVKDFWKEVDRKGHQDTSETSYIADIGSHGSSSYNDATNALKYDPATGTLTINDTPGTNAQVGEEGFYQMAELHLQFETTVLCDGAVVLVFEWSLEYILPPPKGELPKAVVTLLSQK